MMPAILSLADRSIHRYTAPDTVDWGNIDFVDRAAELLSRAEEIEPNDEWLTFYQGLVAEGTRSLEGGEPGPPAADYELPQQLCCPPYARALRDDFGPAQ